MSNTHKTLQHRIKKQIEFYFGDNNLPNDKYLLGKVRESEKGWIPIEMLATFNRVKKLSTDVEFISKCLHSSILLELDSNGTHVRRVKPLQEKPVNKIQEALKSKFWKDHDLSPFTHTDSHMRIISGTSNPDLAQKICDELKHPLTPVTIRRFADGETWCQVQESVRGCDVFIVQSTCSPVNDHLMELLLLVDAIKRASARSITAVMPYYGYARQDRKTKARVPISAALVAKLIESAGVERVCSLDLHCGQIQGFFSCAVDNLFGQPKLANAFAQTYQGDLENDIVVVSPDAGGTERADYFRDALANLLGRDVGMAMMNKKREEANKVARMELIGDVTGKDCIIVDDMIDTAGTLCLAASRLEESGARRVFACASHGLLNGPGVSRIVESVLERVFILNTIPLPQDKQHQKIVSVSVADVLSQTIERINTGSSVSTLFGLEP
eukprot:CAMPEP_0117447930 /NCGR_PEP_ID=MMETSP0759-20121206/7130_1 /TAXON_ID=63605 /ORGANISM="Percolomonas cosmopolitus, Strain WS" /LENGTH=441 /DNA_ID=CAMNT_0005240283 /DNA_START=39 /DNA_END=1364 /DNA_ORIENTATION=-